MFKNYKFGDLFKKATGKIVSQLYKEEKIVVNGLNINIVKVGDGEKTVFLLPGTLGTAWTDFKPQLIDLPKLLPNHKIIAWDPPGYGKSVPPERVFNTNCFQNDAKCAVELMQELSCDKFSMLGWSAGGMTALIIAGRYPELVEKLVIWGAAAHINKQDYSILKELRDVKNFSESMRQPYEETYGRERFAEMWSKCIDTVGNIFTVHNGDVCSQETKNIKAPTFILRGKKDIISSKDHLNFFFEHLPCYKYFEFPEGKHNIHLRYAKEFNKMVAEFLLQDSEQLKADFKKKNEPDLNGK